MTQPSKSTVLVAEDDASMGAFLVRALGKRGFEVRHVPSGAEALAALEAGSFDVVVTDLHMRGMDGITLCKRIVERAAEVPVIVVTAFGSLDTAIQAIRAGAYDFITKPFEIDALELALARAIRHRVLREEVRRLRSQSPEQPPTGELVGRSEAMKRVFDVIHRVAETDVSVLLSGETGTGKEVVARAIHQLSRRSEGPFVAINCSAVPEALLESELFGHVRGAFTDARGPRKGLFQQASGGTLLLDEIGDMPMSLQPKLLRVLQERAVRPVGSDSEVPVDVRVLAATHRDLEAMVEERAFREDLFYRLHVVSVDLPPLRIRGNDVLLLAQHFLEQAARRARKEVRGLSTAAADRLLAYSWPGNVRELANCMERAVALTAHELVAVDDLPPRLREAAPRDDTTPALGDELVTMDEIERRYVVRVMDAVKGNKSQAAQLLGWDRKRLYRKLQKHGLLVGRREPDDE
jgi:two-component system response regulator AtoC